MRKLSYLYLFCFASFCLSCTKIDKTLPIISTLKINDKSGDEVYIGNPKIKIEYEVFDDNLVIDSKIKIIENANLDSGYFYLNIENLNKSNYKGLINITLPDSIFDLSTPLTISIDAFDDSGNQAIQIKTTIRYR